MDINRFVAKFEVLFPAGKRNRLTLPYAWHIPRPSFLKKYWIRDFYFFEPFREVEGLISVKKRKLLQLAYSCLSPGEAYLEVGTWQGKSLIAAMHGNEPRPTYGCDDFSEAYIKRNIDLYSSLMRNLERYHLKEHVVFYQEPFQKIFTKEKLPVAVGLYFYDAAHDEQSQYLGVKLAEPFLNDEALVIVDDWRFAPDSQSYAKVGTERAMAESKNEWRTLYELPARYNTDRAMWWNGLGVLAFRRKKAGVGSQIT